MNSVPSGVRSRSVSFRATTTSRNVIFFGTGKAAQLRPKTRKFPIPDFAIEILSDSTVKRDRGVKFEDYEAHGLREYWIINPDRRELEQYVLEKARYVLRMKSRTGEVASVAIKGFRAPVAAFFEAKANLSALRKILG